MSSTVDEIAGAVLAVARRIPDALTLPDADHSFAGDPAEYELQLGVTRALLRAQLDLQSDSMATRLALSAGSVLTAANRVALRERLIGLAALATHWATRIDPTGDTELVLPPVEAEEPERPDLATV